ncbi:VirD4-like conjugal transfer protein, CD1115 family [Anaerotignum sp.]
MIWLGILFGRCCGEGVNLPQFINNLSEVMETPYHITFTIYTGKCILICLCCYGLGISYYFVSKGNKRTGEEYGSARWGSVSEINRKYKNRKEPTQNAILTQNIQIGLDGRKHRRNLNILVVGGSGAGKTRYFVKPNIMQCNCSYIIADPKGELLRATGGMLEKQGYEVKVLNLVDMARSDCYNPLAYVKTDTDALRLVTNLVKNTTPKTAGNTDPFWDKSETALLQAFILYLVHEAPIEEQNFEMVMYMIENAAVSENDEEYKSPMDVMFETLEEKDPNHIALKQYRVFKQAAGKTAKSILVSVAVRLASFNLSELASFTQKDEMELHLLGKRKQAIFAVIPDNDSSFNYLVGMLYTQAFQELYYDADHRSGGRLKIPVRVLMDEWANVALPDDFEKILATCRSRDISINIIVQNISQIKAMYKDSWESIIGNCDHFLYLGGNEQSTHKYISELLGKATIDTKTRGITKGRSGSSSANYQNTGRELLMPDEVRMLDNDYALLFIRGERAVSDKKYDLMKHPNIKLTEDGGAESYYRPLKNLDKQPIYDFSAEDLQIEFDMTGIEILE